MRNMLSRQTRWLDAVGRLRAGVTVEQARAEIATIAASLEAEYPATNKGWGVVVQPLHEACGDF